MSIARMEKGSVIQLPSALAPVVASRPPATHEMGTSAMMVVSVDQPLAWTSRTIIRVSRFTWPRGKNAQIQTALSTRTEALKRSQTLSRLAHHHPPLARHHAIARPSCLSRRRRNVARLCRADSLSEQRRACGPVVRPESIVLHHWHLCPPLLSRPHVALRGATQ